MRRWLILFAMMSSVILFSAAGFRSSSYRARIGDTVFESNPLWSACVELYPGMPEGDVEKIFERYHLQKQNWTRAGNVEEWWRWNLRGKDLPSKDPDESASLEARTYHGKLDSFACDLTKGSARQHRCNFGEAACPHSQK